MALYGKQKRDKIRVAQLIYKLEVGGAERVVCTIAESLNAKQFDITVIAFKGGPLVKYLSDKQIRTLVLNKSGKVDILFFLRLIREFRNGHYDILHAHTFSANFWGRLAGTVARIPVILTTEHTVADYKKKWQRIADHLLARVSHRIVCVSKEVKDTHVALCGIDPRKVLVIHNGLSEFRTQTIGEKERRKLKTELGLNTYDPVSLTIGRLAAPKGHRILLDAAKRLSNNGIAIQFLIVGEGPLRSDLERQAEQLNIRDQIVFAGFRNDVAQLLQISNIVVSSSFREGFPISLLEAMSMGKSIVATDVGGVREAVESEVSGVLVSSGEPKALEEAISYMLFHPREAAGMGRNAKERFSTYFNIASFMRNIEGLYKSCLGLSD